MIEKKIINCILCNFTFIYKLICIYKYNAMCIVLLINTAGRIDINFLRS